MSQEVDQRVVEMRFDNAKFEKNVQQSINSLNALNESLKFEGAEKGFAEVEKASEKVDFDRMTTALETLTGKFSALEVIGVAALVKITDKAIDAGTRLAKSLSIDQVMSGWNKYAQKTASVQTIMNATGKSITKVNQYLEKLMWFSDETSYGFTDMTSALSTLTAAGGDIEKMIPMIMGMANATAYAGKGAAEFQRVVYNLAQSYGTGAIQLIDWKSVEQAGAGSQQLKQLIIDTAVELGKLKEGEVTTGTFGSTLQKKWADREVMEKAFGKYAEFAEAVNAEMKARPEKYNYQASNAIEALADQYDEVTVKAFKAAQEAKSFSEAVDATKDAVSSGWMQTFDILFGNYEEAKTFWSDLAEQFWDIFAGGMGGRNSWLKKAFNGGMDQLLDDTALGDVGDAFTKQLRRSLIASGKLTEQQIEDAGSFQKALENAGVTADDLYERVQLSIAGYEELAKKSDKELAAEGVSRETLNKTIEAYRKMAEAIQNGEVSLDSYAAKMGQMSGREHFFNGILNILNGINSVLGPIRDGFDEVFHTNGGPLYSLLEGFDNLTSKLVLNEGTMESLTKLFKGLFSVLSVGGKAIRVTGRIALAVIGKLMNALEPLGDLLLQAGAAFGDVFTNLNESLDNAESIDDVINALAVAFGTLLQPVKDIFGLLQTLIHGGTVEEAKGQFKTFGNVVNAVSAVFQNFGLKSISISGALGSAVKLLGGIFFAAFDGVGALIGKTFGAFQDAGKNVGDFKDKHLETLEQVRDTVVSLPEKAGAAMKEFAGSVQTSFYNVADACKAGLSAVKEFFDLNDVDIYRLLALIDVGLLALAIWAVATALKGMQKAIKSVTDATAKLLSNPVTDLLNSMKNAVDTWTKQHTTNNFVNIAKGISIAIGAISASIYMLSKIEDPKQAAVALGMVVATLIGLVVAMKALAKSDVSGLDSAKIMASMVAISIGMLALGTTMKNLASAMKMFKYFNAKQMNNVVGALFSIAAALSIMVGVVGGFNLLTNQLRASSKLKMMDAFKGISSYIVVATAMVEMAGALYLLSSIDEKKLQDGYGALIAISVAMGIVVGVFAALNHWNNTLQAASKNKLNGITNGISSLLVVAAALAGMAVAVRMFAGIENLDNAMWAAMGSLIVMAGVIGALSRLGGKAKKMHKGAEAMLIASASLVVLAQALKMMNEAIAMDESGAGMASMATMLIVMAGAIYILGKSAIENMAAAAAVAAMGFALIELAQALNMIADINVPNLAKGLLALGVALFGLVGAAALLPAATPGLTGVAGACLMLAGALLLLTPAFKGLATLTAGEALAGVIGIIGMMIGMFAIGAITPVAAGMIIVTACLINLGKAFSAFAGGALKLSAAFAILALFSSLIDPLCQAIITAGPDIEKALVTIVSGLCNAIVACAEPIGKAMFALAVTLTKVIIFYLAWLTGAADLSLQGGFDQMWVDLNDWFANHSLFDLISSWLSSGAAAFGNWNPFGMFDLNMNGRSAKTGENAANAINDFDKKHGTRIMGAILELFGFDVVYKDDADTKTTGKNTKNAAEATGVSATNMEKIATAMAVSAKNSGELADGMIQVADDTGKVYTMTAEQAKALMDGKTATEQTAGAVADLGGAAAQTTGKLSGTAAVMRTCAETGAASTEVLDEAGNAIEGKEEQLKDSTDTAVQNAMDEAGDISEEGGKSAASQFMEGFLSRLPKEFKDILNGVGFDISGMESFVSGIGGTSNQSNVHSGSAADREKWFNSWYSNEIKKYDGTSGESWKDLLADIADAVPDPTTAPTGGGSGGGKSSGSAGSKKTLAEQIEEAYKTRLEANKTAQSIIDQEYELWQAENQYSASEDDLMAKKAAHAADAIKAQTERVSIAQAKYDALYSKWGAEKAETKSAYNELLEEKTSLAELRAKQYTDLFEEVAKRYDTNLDTLEKQYNLWSADNDRTATKRDKILKEREYQTEEFAIREKKEANAKEQYEKLGELYGEADLRTIEAYNEWLDAQTESLELRNSIAEKQYELIEADIETIKDAQNLAVSQMELLQKVYNDGNLSSRADDYKSAVETYGKDSKEARAAQYQGTVSGILAAVSAVKSMNAQMEQTLQYKQLLEQAEADGDKERIQSYNEQLLSSQTAFLGFAENLADAFNLKDTGKRAMLKAANVIQKNWQPIRDGFNTAVDKAFANNPELKNKLTDAFKTAFSETGIEVGTEFVSTIVAMMQGDWANALASGLNFMIDFLNTKMGQDLMTTVLPKITELFSNVGKAAKGAQIGQAMGEMGGEMATVATEGGGLITVLQEVAGGIGSVGTAVASFVAEFWPYILAAMVIIGVLAGIAALFNKKNKDAAEAGKDYDKNFSEGITDGKDTVKEAIRDMTDDATDTMASAIFDLHKTADDAFDLTPSITPIVDLSDMESSAQAMDEVFGTYDMTGDVSRKLAAQVDAQTEIQNGMKERSSTELLNAVHALGDRMDGVGESIRGMKMVVDGNKAIGYIDTKLGERSARRMR
nr:MAG TPA: tail tape measure [Bacteriophage sp.]